MVAALFVLSNGPYSGLADVDPWDKKRDARQYAGPWSVVAHPPCERWGRYWHGGPNSVKFPRIRRQKGDDGGCFAAALAAVRKWGGVLEHPEASAAWAAFGLMLPPYDGGWVCADWEGGWTCRVEQGHYGHRARKGTWLYACGVRSLPSLKWGPSARRARLDEGFHSAEERRLFRRPPAGITPEQRAARREWLEQHARETGKEWLCAERLNKRECAETPIPFRDVLLEIARNAGQRRAA